MGDYFVSNGELYHYGILGQKWGIRRFQNKDGTLTDEGIRRYKTNNALSNIGRAITNTATGQRLAVNLNKGYRQDKKEINRLTKERKNLLKESMTDKQDRKEALKELRSDRKKTLGEARVSAAQANYSWQSDALNTKNQTERLGKQFLKGALMGGYGAKTYNELTTRETSKGLSFVVGALAGGVDYATGGLVGIADYAINKRKDPNREKFRKQRSER